MLLKTREDIIKLAADGYSGDAVVERALLARFIDAFELRQHRHKKYGRGNIAQTAATGIAVRLSDKVARLIEIYINKRGTDASDETITDTLLDVINYAGMALVCEAGEWPGAEPTNIRSSKREPIISAQMHIDTAFPRLSAERAMEVAKDGSSKSWPTGGYNVGGSA